MLLYKQIENYLLQLILAADKSEGSRTKLPSEQQLAAKFGASRISVRRATSSLERQGYLYKIKGKGTFVASGVCGKKDAFRFALILPTPESNFNRDILSGVHDFCKSTNSDFIVLYAWQSPEEERKCIELCFRLNIFSVLLMPVDNPENESYIRSLDRSVVKLVFIDRRFGGNTFPLVSSDNFDIGYSAAKYLIGKGHKRVAFYLTTVQSSSVKERIRGYKQAQLELLQKTDPCFVLEEDYTDNGKSLSAWLEKNPEITALISVAGKPANLAIRAIGSTGKEIGKDFDLFVIDDEVFSDYKTNRMIPVILQDGNRMGYAAADELFREATKGECGTDISVPFRFDLR